MIRPAVIASLLGSCARAPEPAALEPAPPVAEAVIALAAEPTSRPAPPEPVVVARGRFLAVGDLLMHTNVKRSAEAAPDGFAALFEPVRAEIASADVAFANLETPVAPRSHRGTASMVFNVSPALLPALREVGFDVVSFANNHVYDQGRDGLVETLEQLDAAGLPQVGSGLTCAAARAPVHLDVGGVRVALIGSTLVFNENLNLGPDEACTFYLDEALALEEAARARVDGAELVLLSVHWGREYRVLPEPEHAALARRLVEGGFDAVIGHHPHVLQPIERVRTADGRDAVIAYSLGNFVSNQRFDYDPARHGPDEANPRDGLMLGLVVERVDHGPGPDGAPDLRTRIAEVQAIPVWTDNDARRIVEPAPVIRVVGLDAALALAEAAAGVGLPGAEGRLALMRARRAQVDAVLAAPVP